MKSLIVYKASAGSGKTFTLAAAFIKLLLCDPHMAYRKTLAVTFTNKATEEMKMRILSQLYGIANGLKDSEGYVKMIKAELEKETGNEISIKWIRERAQMALTTLLHNYSYFKVQTIDTFFQTVLRNLAHELELTASMRVSINQDVAESDAVDQFIESLTQNSKELVWITNYIQNNIDNDQKWNILNDIRTFGKNIFQDVYKERRDELKTFLNTGGAFTKYYDTLKDMSKDAKATMKEEADAFFSKCDALGVFPEQISRGSSLWDYFTKILSGIFEDKIFNSYVRAQHTSVDGWLRKADRKNEQLKSVIEEHLMPILHRTEAKRVKCNTLCESVNETLRHLNELRLLESIESKMDEINKETGRIMLSDTQHLLRDIMKDDDAPFVFEKIGSRIEHIMIDEFQDTSRVQWNNFLPLLRNSMSESTGNLIVGDVKQSIYRWRSGDWRLLNNIGDTFTSKQMKEVSMEYNYRSEANVIDFNNKFFTKASTTLASMLEEECGKENTQQIITAYKKVEQHVPEKKAKQPAHGYVEVRLLKSDLKKEEFAEANWKIVADNIKMLCDKGAKLSDIAVIMRYNFDIAGFASYFMEHYPNIPMVSAEAFHLDASKAVMLMVCGLRWVANETDEVSLAYIRHESGIDGITEILEENREHLCSIPVYDLTEELYAMMNIAERKSESAYVCDFMDRIANFVNTDSSNLTALLEEWDTDMHKQSIESADADGIRLLTIHKSKGLEYKHVFLPLCNWDMTPKSGSLLWCKPKEEPYAELPIVALNNTSKLMQTIYRDDKVYEHLQQEVDDLNMLYVAFTRASENLFVISKQGEKATSRSHLIEKVLKDKLEVIEDNVKFYKYGDEPYVGPDEDTDESKNIFLQQSEPLMVDISNHKSNVVYRQSNQSEIFVGNEEAVERQQYIECGNILHEVFRNISSMDDIATELRKLEMEGLLYGDAAMRIDIERMIEQAMSNDKVQEWFDGHWKLFRECSILVPNTETGRMKEQRPDRVMTDGKRTIVIDYKSGVPRPSHREQMQGYIDLLRRMGMPGVEGWLWYINDNKTIEVR